VALVGCGQPAVTHEEVEKEEAEMRALLNSLEAEKEATEAKAAADWKVIDEWIRSALLFHYGENPKGELTKADYEKVTKLSLKNIQLTEVPKGLEKLTQLTSLHLWKNQITDLTPLKDLTQLTTLPAQPCSNLLEYPRSPAI